MPTKQRMRNKAKRKTKTKEHTRSPLVAEAEGTSLGRGHECESVAPSGQRTRLGDVTVQRLSGVFGPRSPLRASVVPRGLARAFAAPTLPRARKKRTAKKPDEASPFLASGEGTLPERDSDSENTARSHPPTSLGDGVVKPGGGRIAWAQLLRRGYLVDVLACRWGGRRAIVGEISEREGVMAIVAHLGLEAEAPPRSPAFELA